MTIFRAPVAADAAALAALVEGLNGHQGDPTGNFTAEKALRDVITPGAPLSCIVAEEAGRLTGFAFWHFAYEAAYAARGGFITDLYVEETRRGSGLADALLRAAARRIKTDGGEYLWLTTHRTNERARAFYRKHMTEEGHVVVEFAAWDQFAALCG
ncbi:MAG: GNAT family N-acetyltransferase [Paracoccaceae bacterium]